MAYSAEDSESQIKDISLTDTKLGPRQTSIMVHICENRECVLVVYCFLKKGPL